MNVFETSAKLTLDTHEYDEGMADAGNKAGIFADVLKADLVSKGISVAIEALKKLGEVAVDVFQKSVSAYADYEQLQGGIETMFKSSSDTILQYAENAYKTAGMSANQYLDTVMGFSASLIQSTGRGEQQDLEALEKTLDQEYLATKRSLDDQYEAQKKYWDDQIDAVSKGNSKKKKLLQEQRDSELKALKRSYEDQLSALKAHNKEAVAEAEKLNMKSVTTEESLERAAKLANMAIEDMSDNANKMGTDMASIQNAYQGFAKQNFAMLDNLKIGYGGSRAEMERLLADAERIKASQGELADYSVQSYADIVEAIHVVQTEMGITGTTAAEAENTISGSLNMVKSAWENLIKGLADGNADIDELIQNLFAALNKFWDNIKPVAERVIKHMIEAIIKALPEFVKLGGKIAGAILEGILQFLLTPLKWLRQLIFGKTSYELRLESEKELEEAIKRNYGRAKGGSVSANQPYIVGEEGPELLVPSTSGHVFNTEQTAGILDGRGISNININIGGDVYDDENSMRGKLRTAVIDILSEQVVYG